MPKPLSALPTDSSSYALPFGSSGALFIPSDFPADGLSASVTTSEDPPQTTVVEDPANIKKIRPRWATTTQQTSSSTSTSAPSNTNGSTSSTQSAESSTPSQSPPPSATATSTLSGDSETIIVEGPAGTIIVDPTYTAVEGPAGTIVESPAGTIVEGPAGTVVIGPSYTTIIGSSNTVIPATSSQPLQTSTSILPTISPTSVQTSSTVSPLPSGSPAAPPVLPTTVTTRTDTATASPETLPTSSATSEQSSLTGSPLSASVTPPVLTTTASASLTTESAAPPPVLATSVSVVPTTFTTILQPTSSSTEPAAVPAEKTDDPTARKLGIAGTVIGVTLVGVGVTAIVLRARGRRREYDSEKNGSNPRNSPIQQESDPSLHGLEEAVPHGAQGFRWIGWATAAHRHWSLPQERRVEIHENVLNSLPEDVQERLPEDIAQVGRRAAIRRIGVAIIRGGAERIFFDRLAEHVILHNAQSSATYSDDSYGSDASHHPGSLREDATPPRIRIGQRSTDRYTTPREDLGRYRRLAEQQDGEAPDEGTGRRSGDSHRAADNDGTGSLHSGDTNASDDPLVPAIHALIEGSSHPAQGRQDSARPPRTDNSNFEIHLVQLTWDRDLPTEVIDRISAMKWGHQLTQLMSGGYPKPSAAQLQAERTSEKFLSEKRISSLSSDERGTTTPRSQVNGIEKPIDSLSNSTLGEFTDQSVDQIARDVHAKSSKKSQGNSPAPRVPQAALTRNVGLRKGIALRPLPQIITEASAYSPKMNPQIHADEERGLDTQNESSIALRPSTSTSRYSDDEISTFSISAPLVNAPISSVMEAVVKLRAASSISRPSSSGSETAHSEYNSDGVEFNSKEWRAKRAKVMTDAIKQFPKAPSSKTKPGTNTVPQELGPVSSTRLRSQGSADGSHVSKDSDETAELRRLWTPIHRFLDDASIPSERDSSLSMESTQKFPNTSITSSPSRGASASSGPSSIYSSDDPIAYKGARHSRSSSGVTRTSIQTPDRSIAGSDGTASSQSDPILGSPSNLPTLSSGPLPQSGSANIASSAVKISNPTLRTIIGDFGESASTQDKVAGWMSHAHFPTPSDDSIANTVQAETARYDRMPSVTVPAPSVVNKHRIRTPARNARAFAANILKKADEAITTFLDKDVSAADISAMVKNTRLYKDVRNYPLVNEAITAFRDERKKTNWVLGAAAAAGTVSIGMSSAGFDTGIKERQSRSYGSSMESTQTRTNVYNTASSPRSAALRPQNASPIADGFMRRKAEFTGKAMDSAAAAPYPVSRTSRETSKSPFFHSRH